MRLTSKWRSASLGTMKGGGKLTCTYICPFVTAQVESRSVGLNFYTRPTVFRNEKKKEQTFSEITRRKGSLDRSDLCCCFQSHKDFEKVNIGRGEVASVRLCVCLCLSIRRQLYLRSQWSDSYQSWDGGCLSAKSWYWPCPSFKVTQILIMKIIK